jgi:osmoprotectant transport system permease protein
MAGRAEGEEMVRRRVAAVSQEMYKVIMENAPIRAHFKGCFKIHPECAVKAVGRSAGLPLTRDGFTPSLFALTLLALPPIVQNTLAGLRSVDPDVVDAARGMGMAQGEILRRVELPIALPAVFAGLRTAAVQVVSGAVLAAFIGGGGLGDFITAGIAMMALPQLLVGAIPVTLLALGVDYAFGAAQRRLTPAGLRAP